MFGQAGPAIETIMKGRMAAKKLYTVIDRVPSGRAGIGTYCLPRHVTSFKSVCV